ncbi:DUF7662 domain-containing protein [Deinococcus yavapaiensis]|uniref:DUF7662 domain-containing protein n=1 Tax=Deinococcus yavapaiensis KR-236 TaxID=694435 RepID=A0A318SD32_9DEIO|nr:hypothetical protein DES52_103137 [Deinococcus yavapaiensis KR-236]
MRVLKVQLQDGERTLLTTEVATTLTPEELLRLLPQLLGPTPTPPQVVSEPRQSRKYAGLAHHLETLTETTIRLSYQDIETLIGGELPSSARKHRAWWSNTNVGHSQAAAWMNVGWRVNNVDEEGITFRKHGGGKV